MVLLGWYRFHQFEHEENENTDANNGEEEGKTTDEHENVVEEIVSGSSEFSIISLIIKGVPLFFDTCLWALCSVCDCVSVFIDLLGLFGFKLCFIVLFLSTGVDLLLIPMVDPDFKLDVPECGKLSRTC